MDLDKIDTLELWSTADLPTDVRTPAIRALPRDQVPTVARTNGLALNFVSLALAEGIARGAGMVVFVVAARLLGVAAIGEIAFASSFVLVFTFVSDFGLTTLGMRDVARRKQDTNRYGTNILTFQVLLSLLLITIAGAILYFMPISAALQRVTLFYLLGIIPFTLDMSYLFQAHEKMHFVLLSKTINQGLYLVVGVVLMIVLRSAVAVPIAALVGGLVSAGLTYVLLRRVLQFKLSRPDGQFLRVLITAGIPFVSAAILIEVYRNTDAIMLQFLRGTEAVGYYAAGYKIVNAATLLLTTVQTTFLPLLSRTFQHDKRGFRQHTLLFSQVSGVVSLPLVAGGIMYSKQIIELLYGNALVPSVPVFRVLLLLLAVSPLRSVAASLNIVADQPRQYVTSGVLGVALNLGLNFMLIPRFGAVGAGISIVATEAVAAFYLLATCSRFLSYRDVILVLGRFWFKPTIAMLAMLAVTRWLQNMYVGVPVAAVAYLVVLGIVGGLPTRTVLADSRGAETTGETSRAPRQASGEFAPAPSPSRRPSSLRPKKYLCPSLAVALVSISLLLVTGLAGAYQGYQQIAHHITRARRMAASQAAALVRNPAVVRCIALTHGALVTAGGAAEAWLSSDRVRRLEQGRIGRWIARVPRGAQSWDAEEWRARLDLESLTSGADKSALDE